MIVLITAAKFVAAWFTQKTAYEIGTGDWSSDVCSSDLVSRTPDPEKGELSYAEAVHSGAQVVFNTKIGRASCRERV